ncbi:MAG: hypothetical protein QM723_31335 [Myxococcaceae bacterium]
MRRAAVFLARLFIAFCGVWPLGGALVWLLANGLCLGVLQFLALALACFVVALPLPAWVRSLRWQLALALVCFEMLVPAVRWSRASAPELRHCFNWECGTTGPPWAFLAPEDETAFAGMLLSRWTGVVSAAEASSYGPTMRAGYASTHRLANPQLLMSFPGSVHWYYRAPPHAEGTKVPCIVFLHGFGGLLTPYLDAMAQSPLGERYALAAPVLDDVAPWWTERGGTVIEETIANLPPEVDRHALFMIGLSNGSIGGAQYTGWFRAAVLLSGVGDVPRNAHVLVISGTRDARISPEWVKTSVEHQREEHADIAVEWLDGDHFLILSRAKEWTKLAAEFFDRQHE